MKVKLEEVERYERHVKMRLAFRFAQEFCETRFCILDRPSLFHFQVS
jgi:hypothetical protein